jgi:hypothetical protein
MRPNALQARARHRRRQAAAKKMAAGLMAAGASVETVAALGELPPG